MSLDKGQSCRAGGLFGRGIVKISCPGQDTRCCKFRHGDHFDGGWRDLSSELRDLRDLRDLQEFAKLDEIEEARLKLDAATGPSGTRAERARDEGDEVIACGLQANPRGGVVPIAEVEYLTVEKPAVKCDTEICDGAGESAVHGQFVPRGRRVRRQTR